MRTLLRDGRIHTPSDPHATALLVVDGDVAWVGSAGAAQIHADGVDRVVELGGALVTPGFVDAHMHHTEVGLTLVGLDLRVARSREEALELVARAVRLGGAVLGHGWDESAWPVPAPPTREELDRAAGGAPVYLSRVDVHSAVVSSALVAAVPGLAQMAGFAASGLVTGPAHTAARQHLAVAMPGGLRERAQRAARRHAAQRGIVALHEAAGPDINGVADLLALQDLCRAEAGPELVAYWGSLDLEEVLALGAVGAAGDLFVDGSLGSRTALLEAPYADDPQQSGRSYLSAQAVAEHLVACTRAGVQGGFHAIGDRALRVVVEGLRAAIAACGVAAVRACRHRIEHACMCSREMAQELAGAGVVLSMQPAFDAAWGGPGGVYQARLGRERAAGLHDLAGLVAAGAMLALGSDAPVTPLDPWAGVRAAAFTHNPASRISVRAAFNAATRGGWRAARRDGPGVLVPGAPASLAIWDAGELGVAVPDAAVRSWSTDPRSGTPGLPRLDPGLPLPTCRATVLAGRVLYSVDPEWLPVDG